MLFSSLLRPQVVRPCLPVGQLDSAVGESRADWCHLSLLTVSLCHSGPQQLSQTQHPGISLRQFFFFFFFGPDWTWVAINQKLTPDTSLSITIQHQRLLKMPVDVG